MTWIIHMHINFISPNMIARVKQNKEDYRQYRENKRTCRSHNYNYYFSERKKEKNILSLIYRLHLKVKPH